MPLSNPMGNPLPWRQPRSTRDPRIAAESLRQTLTDCFVTKTGHAKEITLETDPQTGNPVLHVYLTPGSSLPQELKTREINGIGVRFSPEVTT